MKAPVCKTVGKCRASAGSGQTGCVSWRGGDVGEVIEAMKQLRRGRKLRGLSIRYMIREGRRF